MSPSSQPVSGSFKALGTGSRRNPPKSGKSNSTSLSISTSSEASLHSHVPPLAQAKLHPSPKDSRSPELFAREGIDVLSLQRAALA